MKHMNSEVKEERTSNKKRIDLFLVPIVLIAAFLNLFKIWTDEYANAYYTAAVKSMLQSFHNFFYASFDPGGYVTIDKPPVVFWIQTISAKIFGFHGWSVILPQALAGIGSVLLLYVLVKRTFGVWAGRFAALAMALTPIVPAVSRTNNIDSMLVFTLLVATWMLFRAVRTAKFGWVLAAFAMIGVAFNMKMLQAYMVLPAFYVFYVVATKITWKKKIAFLTTATALMLAVSVSWAVVVDSTSADKRPYMGSSQTNSVLELAFGYNGINRLTGNTSVTGSSHKQPAQTEQQTASSETKQNSNSSADSSQSSNQRKSSSSQKMQAPGGGNQNGMFNTGNPGPFRLFQKGLSDQISWLLPFVIFSIVGLFAGVKFKGGEYGDLHNFSQFHRFDLALEVLHQAHALIAISRDVEEDLLRWGFPTKHIHFIPNGVDTNYFQRTHAAPRRDPVRFLLTGRRHPQKGIDLALQAAHLLRQQGLAQQFHINFYGADYPEYDYAQWLNNSVSPPM